MGEFPCGRSSFYGALIISCSRTDICEVVGAYACTYLLKVKSSWLCMSFFLSSVHRENIIITRLN